MSGAVVPVITAQKAGAWLDQAALPLTAYMPVFAMGTRGDFPPLLREFAGSNPAAGIGGDDHGP